MYHSLIVQALLLAKAALDLTENESLRADCLCVIARAHHGLGNMNDAYKTYLLVRELRADQKYDML
jgi:hypothetical protein